MAELEGVVKYAGDHRAGPDPKLGEVVGLIGLWHTARAWNWIGQDESGIGYGNASQRDQNQPETFWISGTQTGGRQTLPVEGICRVLHWNFGHNSVLSEGPVLPSSEAMTHAAIYGGNLHVQCVVHVHCNRLWEVLLEDHPFTPEKARYGTPDLAVAVEELTRSMCLPALMIMSGHRGGLLFWGSNFDEVSQLMTTYRQMELALQSCELA